jgi:hypothetical protein
VLHTRGRIVPGGPADASVEQRLPDRGPAKPGRHFTAEFSAEFTIAAPSQDPQIVRAARAEPGLRVLALDFDREALTGRAAKKALHWRQKLG